MSLSNRSTGGHKQIKFPKRHVFQYLEFRTMDKVLRPSNFGCYTPSSKPFRLLREGCLVKYFECDQHLI
jgi:hypothetical protein